MTGTDLIRSLRAENLAIPIIMMSGDPKVRKEAQEAGANAFIEKSLNMASIRKQIRQLLQD